MGVTPTSTSNLLPGDVPPTPAKGDGKLEDAVQDFLNSWLVEQKPEFSAAYFATRSFTCLKEYAPDTGRIVNAGNAPYVAAKDLAVMSHAIGKVPNVQGGVQPATLIDKEIKFVKQPYASTFALYELSNAAAA